MKFIKLFFLGMITLMSHKSFAYNNYGDCVTDVYKDNGYNLEAARKTCNSARIRYDSYGVCVTDVYKDNGYNLEAARKTCTNLISDN